MSIANFSQHEVLTAEKLNAAFNDLEAAMEELPDGSAVSVKVAEHTTEIASAQESISALEQWKEGKIQTDDIADKAISNEKLDNTLQASISQVSENTSELISMANEVENIEDKISKATTVTSYIGSNTAKGGTLSENCTWIQVMPFTEDSHVTKLDFTSSISDTIKIYICDVDSTTSPTKATVRKIYTYDVNGSNVDVDFYVGENQIVGFSTSAKSILYQTDGSYIMLYSSGESSVGDEINTAFTTNVTFGVRFTITKITSREYYDIAQIKSDVDSLGNATYNEESITFGNGTLSNASDLSGGLTWLQVVSVPHDGTLESVSIPVAKSASCDIIIFTVDNLASPTKATVKAKKTISFSNSTDARIGLSVSENDCIGIYSSSTITTYKQGTAEGKIAFYKSGEVSVGEVVTDIFASGMNLSLGLNYVLTEKISASENIENIKEELLEKTNDPTSGLNAVILGDSITWLGGDDCDNGNCTRTDVSQGGWTKTFKEQTKFTTIKSYARSGATWSHTENTVYHVETDDQGATTDNNVIYNQIQRVFLAYDAGTQPQPDIIIIACGTNDAWFPDKRPDALSVTADDEFANTDAYKTVSNINTLVSIADAMRHDIEILKRKFPSCQIIICTPLQSASISFDRLRDTGDIIEDCARYMSCNVIRQDKECCIYRAEEKNGYVNTYDGTHTSAVGAQKNGKIIANRVKNILQY